MSRQGESFFKSRRQPPVIFTACTPSGDHEQDFATLEAWSSTRCYTCSFCGREFNSAQALGGHMNIHRRDRARLRTFASGSLSLPLHHADSSPILENTAKLSRTALHQPSEVTCREESTSICSSLDSYSDPVIRAATPAFERQHSATDPAFMHSALSAPFSQCREKSDASSAILPVLDLVCNRARTSSPSSFSQIQREAESFCQEMPPSSSLPLRRPMLQDSILKPGPRCQNAFSSEAIRGRDFNIDWWEAKGVGDASHEGIPSIQFLASKKRARSNSDTTAAAQISCEAKSALQWQYCDKQPSNPIVSTTKTFSSLHAPADFLDRPCSARPLCDLRNDHKARSCLDLELRLGQRSPTPGADSQCPWTYKNGLPP